MIRRLLLVVLWLCLPALAQEPKLLQPALPAWFLAEEPVALEVEAGAGRQLSLRIPDESEVALTEGPPGHYRATVRPDGTAALLLVEGGKVVTSLGTLECLELALPVAEVTRDQAVFRSGPTADFDRYDPVTAGVRLEVTGRRGDWLRTPAGWIAVGDVKLWPTGTTVEPAILSSVRAKESPDGAAEFHLRLSQPCPWQTRETPQGLTVVLPGAAMAMYETAYPPDPVRVQSIVLRPGAHETQVELGVGRLSGYTLRWEAPDLVVRLQPPLPRRLEGLRVVLDAGHGGSDPGAVGLHGMKEADANLAVTRALQRELENAGAQVTLTRSADVEVAGGSAEGELAARVAAAEAARGQLFVSIHHNASANVATGRVAHGTHVYYYRLQSNELARALARPLAGAIGEPSSMHLWRSFALTRQTGMPAVLVEVNFISNPQLERGMLGAPGYAERAAQGLRRGLEDYLGSL